MPIPSVLKHEDYRDGTNDQIFLMSPEDWKNVFANIEDQGAPPETFVEFRQFLTKDSMSLKEAINFIKVKSDNKDQILKMLFGEEKYEKFNFLPVSKFTLPVNKQNAVKSGTISGKDLGETVDNISIDYKSNRMFKNNLILLDILANFDWTRAINFSSGGIYDPENIFFLGDYLQFDGFSYRLVPIKTKEREDGEMGRVDANSLYNIVKNYKWGNFKDLSVHFDETCTQNIVSYRSSVSRAAEALTLSGQKAKALELLDLASREIPVQKYNDPRSLSSIVYGYLVSGQEQKGLKLAEELKKEIFVEYDYYGSLSADEQRFVSKQMRTKPLEYSLIIGAITDAYEKIGQKEKAYSYLVKSIEPVDKRFQNFVKDLQTMGREKAINESEKVQKITPFYTYLFDVMEPYDSTYAQEKENQITNAMMKATQ